MNKAPRLERLLKVAEIVNPNWYPFIYGYLNEELYNLEVDNSDEGNYPEQGYPELNLGNFNTCVVAEPFGFSGQYDHNGIENCGICNAYGQRLYNNSGVENEEGELDLDYQRDQFAETLEDFYKHRGFMK